ncbi:porin family protein [Ruegeria sediminis]|uniref:Porin family protein n=1 Tax=Ruegeria sediminis TaxID=2583820 RepID=A0ABY2X5G6_9RHOB|nr:outer membrane beta-barrel protein [Ruegeria sediminis]TMV10289.1 porin family protein [Ruegeria sediminis]
MTRNLAIFSALSVLAAGHAMAQSTTESTESYVAQYQSTLVPSNYEWTGFFVGGQLGYVGVDTSLSGIDGDDWIGGLNLGYDYDFGTWVLGGGFDYDWTDVSLGSGVSVDDVWRLRVRAGYKIQDGLLYGVGGYAEASTNTLGSDDGWFIGGGYEHVVYDDFTVSGEILYHEFNNFNGTGVDVDATTVQVRAAFRF